MAAQAAAAASGTASDDAAPPSPRTITASVMVEGSADAKQLQAANVSSWEHGLIRETDAHTRQLKGKYLVARGEADAPDIDGRIYVRGELPVGAFAKVKIIGHTDYDLIAEPV